MADEQTATPPTAASATSPTVASGPADRASVLADLAAFGADDTPAADPAPAADPTDTPEAAEPAAKAEDDATDGDEAEAEDKPPAAAEEPADPQLAKRLESVQRAEKRAKEAVARERQEFAAERTRFEAEWAPRIDKVTAVEKIMAGARIDPAELLRACGVPEDEFEWAAKEVYRKSPQGRADPKNREASARAQAERQQATALEQVQRELREFKEQAATREENTRLERAAVDYLDATVKSVTDEAPLVRNMLSKAPEKTRVRLAEVAMELAQLTDEAPDHADVVAELEKRRRAELDELGVDIDAVLKSSPKSKTPVTGEKKPAKTLSSGMGAPTAVPVAPATREELAQQTLAELKSLA